MRFIIRQNDQEVIKNFLSLDKNKGYTRHLLTTFASMQKLIHSSAFAAFQKDKIFKSDLAPVDKFEKKHNIKCKVFDDLHPSQDPDSSEEHLTYLPKSTRKFKAKFLQFWPQEDYLKITEQAPKAVNCRIFLPQAFDFLRRIQCLLRICRIL